MIHRHPSSAAALYRPRHARRDPDEHPIAGEQHAPTHHPDEDTAAREQAQLRVAAADAQALVALGHRATRLDHPIEGEQQAVPYPHHDTGGPTA